MRVIGNLHAQAVLRLTGQMLMHAEFHPALQAQSNEQADGNGEEMDKKVLEAVQLTVRQVNVSTISSEQTDYSSERDAIYETFAIFPTI